MRYNLTHMKRGVVYLVLGAIAIAAIVIVFSMKKTAPVQEKYVINWVSQAGGKRGIFKEVPSGGKELLGEFPLSKYPESLALEIVGRYGDNVLIHNIGEVNCAFENEYDLWLFNPQTRHFTDLQNGLSYLGNLSPDGRYYVFGDLETVLLRVEREQMPRQESNTLKVLDIEKNAITTVATIPKDQTLVAEVQVDPYCETPRLDTVWSGPNQFKYLTYPAEEQVVTCTEDSCDTDVKRSSVVQEIAVSL